MKPRKSKRTQTSCKNGKSTSPAENRESDTDDDGNDGSDVEEVGSSSNSCKLFACPNEGCVKTYQRYGSMVNHTMYGQCLFQPERESLLDTAKVMYSKKLLGASNIQMSTTETADVVPLALPHETLDAGWALRTTKPSKPFSEKQKRFLDEKFTIGETTGRKLDPVTVVRQMRVARGSDGQRMFTPEELLSANQIQGFFSRRAKCKNQAMAETADEDFVAAEVEDAMARVRNEVLQQTQPSHPFSYDGYNLCDLVSTDSLKTLTATCTVAKLRDICCYFGLEVNSLNARRKAPYTELLEKLVRSCSCFDKLPAD